MATLKEAKHNDLALIFDLGGVVFEWNPTYFLIELCTALDVHTDHLEVVRSAVFQDYGLTADWTSFDRGTIDLRILSTRIVQRLRTASDQVHGSKFIGPGKSSSSDQKEAIKIVSCWVNKIGPALQPIASTVALLGKIEAQGYPMMFLSNMPHPYIPHIKEHQNVFRHFSTGIFSSDVSLVKPEPQIFTLAEEWFSSVTKFHSKKEQSLTSRRNPQDYIFIDDSEANIAAAKIHGWRTIKFLNTAQAETELDALLSELNPRVRTIRSYVIRAGRAGSGQLRALEKLAPSYVIDTKHFSGCLSEHWPADHRFKPLLVEIGFGMGESLALAATRDRSKRFLGIEVHPPGVGSMLQRIDANGLDHVRLIQHDAVEVLQNMIKPGSVAAFHIYFPDPWPKTRHHKRRLIQPEFASLLTSRLQAGGYVHCATDWEPYAHWMLEVLGAAAGLVNMADGYHERPLWRLMTKFEARGLKLGYEVRDLLFQKKA